MKEKKETEVEKARKLLETERQKTIEGFNKEFAELCEKWNVNTSFGANGELISQVFLEAFTKIKIEMIVTPK